MKKLSVTLMLFVFLHFDHSICKAENYGEKLTKNWQKIFGIDPKKDGEYRWFAYPVDNFGVLTSYDPPTTRAWIDSDRICATWSCIESKPPDDIVTRISVNGFADPGEGGPVTLDEKTQKKFGLGLLLPGLADLFKIGGKLDWSKGVKIVMKMEKGYKRSINRDRYNTFVAERSSNKTLKSAHLNGRLAYVAADILVEGISAEITVDKKVNAGVDAALTKAAGIAPKDASLKFEWSSSTDGVYKLLVKHPVVLAVQIRRQERGGVLTAGESEKIISTPLPKPVL